MAPAAAVATVLLEIGSRVGMEYEDIPWNHIFMGSIVLCFLLTLWLFDGFNGCVSKGEAQDPAFLSFRNSYLVVFGFMVAGDWLQGPFVFALYEAYGFPMHEIAMLFVAGFGSSLVLGTFIGSYADSFGRKRWGQLYVVLYILSCLTKHVKDFKVLMVGRVLGGIATSLLFSTFESWLVKEHAVRKFPEELLGNVFSLQMSLNSIVAIMSGVAGHLVADSCDLQSVQSASGSLITSNTDWYTYFSNSVYVGGYCAPFDLAIVSMLIGLLIMNATWSENYGDESEGKGSGLIPGIKAVFSSAPIMLAGSAQFLFESSMYIFVFMWTPALTADEDRRPPYGVIFSTFMACAMAGSSLFGLLSSKVPASRLFWISSAVASLAFASMVMFQNLWVFTFAFLIFEGCVGMYFPSMAFIKSSVVPEEVRATVYNLVRVPLNAIVVAVLLTLDDYTVAFQVCTLMCLACVVIGLVLEQRVEGKSKL